MALTQHFTSCAVMEIPLSPGVMWFNLIFHPLLSLLHSNSPILLCPKSIYFFYEEKLHTFEYVGE